MRSWTAEFLSVLECVSTEINTLDFLRCSFGSFAVFSPFFFFVCQTRQSICKSCYHLQELSALKAVLKYTVG